MFKVIMRGLLARKFRLVATALAVTLGVAFMAGTLVLTDTFGQTFNDLSAGVYKGTDAAVRATAVFNGPQFTGEQRPFVNASLADTLSRVPGVGRGGLAGRRRGAGGSTPGRRDRHLGAGQGSPPCCTAWPAWTT